jgi:hypothetical protein
MLFIYAWSIPALFIDHKLNLVNYLNYSGMWHYMYGRQEPNGDVKLNSCQKSLLTEILIICKLWTMLYVHVYSRNMKWFVCLIINLSCAHVYV